MNEPLLTHRSTTRTATPSPLRLPPATLDLSQATSVRKLDFSAWVTTTQDDSQATVASSPPGPAAIEESQIPRQPLIIGDIPALPSKECIPDEATHDTPIEDSTLNVALSNPKAPASGTESPTVIQAVTPDFETEQEESQEQVSMGIRCESEPLTGSDESTIPLVETASEGQSHEESPERTLPSLESTPVLLTESSESREPSPQELRTPPTPLPYRLSTVGEKDEGTEKVLDIRELNKPVISPSIVRTTPRLSLSDMLSPLDPSPTLDQPPAFQTPTAVSFSSKTRQPNSHSSMDPHRSPLSSSKRSQSAVTPKHSGRTTSPSTSPSPAAKQKIYSPETVVHHTSKSQTSPKTHAMRLVEGGGPVPHPERMFNMGTSGITHQLSTPPPSPRTVPSAGRLPILWSPMVQNSSSSSPVERQGQPERLSPVYLTCPPSFPAGQASLHTPPPSAFNTQSPEAKTLHGEGDSTHKTTQTLEVHIDNNRRIPPFPTLPPGGGPIIGIGLTSPFPYEHTVDSKQGLLEMTL